MVVVHCSSNRKQQSTATNNMDLSWDNCTPLRYGPAYNVPASSKCDEIRRKTHHSHLSYLNMDDTPAKIDHRVKLEELVTELLSLVPHKQKFDQPEVGECLNKSIVEIVDDFSAYDAGLAFESLEKLATNVLNQPWRREFLVIKPYSGFYRFKVEKHVVNAKSILTCMGYGRQETEDGSLHFTDTPADPDKLARVAFDCLVAYVECQIMLQIFDNLKSRGVDVTFQEIHAVRRRFVCGHEVAAQIIAEAKQTITSQQQELCSTNSGHVSQWNGSQVSERNQQQKPLRPTNVSGLGGRSPRSELCESFDLMHFPLTSNGYHSSMAPTSPSAFTQAPSARFMYPNPNPPSPLNYITPPPAMFANEPPQLTGYATLQSNASTTSNYKPFQNGYLTDNLRHGSSTLPFKQTIANGQGASSSNNRQKLKSTAPRPGVLQSGDLDMMARGQQVNGTTVSNQTLKSYRANGLSDAVDGKDKYAANCEPNDLLATSCMQSSSGTRRDSLKKAPGEMYSTQKNSPRSASQDYSHDNISNCSSDEVDGARRSSADANSWACTFCTYINNGGGEKSARNICRMCSRSRATRLSEMQLESGGRECSNCTLVNERKRTNCSACNTSLLDSPTYI